MPAEILAVGAARYAPIVRVSPTPSQQRNQALPHVLLVVDGFPKVLGGGERVVLRMAELLPRYGYSASILTFSLAPDGEFDPARAPCPIYLLALTKTYDLKALRGAVALRRFLRGEKVALVQTFFESSDLWAGTIARLFSSARLVWSRRDMGILRGTKHAAAYRAFRKLPDAVFAVSEQVRQHVLSEDRVDPARVFTVYNGLDLDNSEQGPPQASANRTHVTTVGNIRHVKGHDVLLEAAVIVLKQHPEAHFTIAGSVLELPYFEQLQRRLKVLGIQDRFRFLGSLRNLSEHLATAGVFVLPSRSEGFSNALVEAMAAGLPCVATTVGGNAEAIQDGVNGILVPPDDVQTLATALCRVLANAEQAKELGAAARRTASARFTADAMMQNITNQYARLLRKE